MPSIRPANCMRLLHKTTMEDTILILDDDATFNNLLTTVFSKAKKKYNITSIHKGEEALKIINQKKIDLVITDLRMPEITGLDFTKIIRSTSKIIPVIMVSAYLDAESIRKLANMGVNAIFLKPINLFALLQRTEELLLLSKERKASSLAKEKDSTGTENKGLETSMLDTFPCLSDVTKRLATNLEDQRDFNNVLLLIGPPGSPFTPLINDFNNLSKNKENVSFQLAKKDLNKESVDKVINEAIESGFKRITVSFPLIEVLNDEEKQFVTTLLKSKPKELPEGRSIRFILCMHSPVDLLLEKGIINDVLYIIIGNNEINIPTLKECEDDIPLLAEKLVLEYTNENKLTEIPKLSSTTLNYLLTYSWPGNYDEFKAYLVKTFKKSINKISLAKHLEEYLLSITEDYTTALKLLNTQN